MSTLWDEKLDVMDVAEVHWGTSTILAIFFAAALVSAVFFGLGYSFGRGGTPNSVGSSTFSDANAPAVAVAPEKSEQDRSASVVRTDSKRPTAHPALAQVSANGRVHPSAASAKAANPASINPRSKPVAREAAAHYMVQVGAIGNRKDARTLIAHLRKRGFHAGIYESKRDKFLHVQIGPFATPDQAQAMRHHVIASGYRAILKRSA